MEIDQVEFSRSVGQNTEGSRVIITYSLEGVFDVFDVYGDEANRAMEWLTSEIDPPKLVVALRQLVKATVH